MGAVRFLDFDPEAKEGPYAACEESLSWLSEDRTLFRAGMHNIDVRLDRWPGKVGLQRPSSLHVSTLNV
jgi:hypothetical protein